MLAGVSFLPASFPPSRTQAFYIIKRQNCLNICNTVQLMNQMPQKKKILKQGPQCWRHLRLYYFAETYLNGFLPTVVVIVFQLMFRIYLQGDQQLHISWVMSNNHCYHTGIQIHDFLAFEDHKHQEICSLHPVRKMKSNAVNGFFIFPKYDV